MRPLKIAKVATSDLSLAVLLRDQIKRLQEEGYEVVAICSPGPWIEPIRKEGIPVETVKMSREINLFQDMRSLFALYRCFRKYQFDVVHSHTPKAGILAPIAAKLAQVPTVVHTVHGFLCHDKTPYLKRSIFWFFEKITALFSDALLSQSREDMRRAVEWKICDSKKIHYLGNGIDPSFFNPNGETSGLKEKLGFGQNDRIIGTVGRLVYEKGYREFFEAAGKLVKKYPDLKFVMIGPQEPDQKDSITLGSDVLNHKDVYRFLGWQKDLRPWYSVFDIFVLPSHREGIPRACMEAAAMKCPVVTTDIRGCREVVLEGVNGLLVEPRNSDAVADAIERLLLNEPLRRQMGEMGRRHVMENFTTELVLERLTNFYSQLKSRGFAGPNLLTIDLEDWHQLAHKRMGSGWPLPSARVFRQTDGVLDLLREQKTKATFFVLGILAEKFPQWVKQIASEGHEIASHGYAHDIAFRLTREAFRRDAQKSKKLLEDITGQKILGFRAAEFSIVSRNLWALEVLAEEGFSYDSSIFPVLSRRYGIPDFALPIQKMNLSNGLSITEFPLAVFSVGKWRIPYAGGGYFRLWPLGFTQFALKQMNSKQVPATFYFHPYEFDPEDLRMGPFERASLRQRLRSAVFTFHQNLGRKAVGSKLRRLLSENRFTTCRDFIEKAGNERNRIFQSTHLLSK